MDDTLTKLTNPEFDFGWNGKVYRLRKATLRTVAAYEARSQQMQKEGKLGTDALLGAYAIYLMIKPLEPDLTEDIVLDNTPGDIFVLDLLGELGFMNTTRVMAALQSLTQKISPGFSSESPKGLDGHPTI